VKADTFSPVPNLGMITISIMMANIMQGVDNTILNVALPHIQGSLSASLDQIAWALTSYIVCAAIMMPLTGWLAGRFGIKYIFLASVIGFTLASALCGAATSLGELVVSFVRAGRGRSRTDPAVAGDPLTDPAEAIARIGGQTG
jgi:DHA2 family multidrug resistance protein